MHVARTLAHFMLRFFCKTNVLGVRDMDRNGIKKKLALKQHWPRSSVSICDASSWSMKGSIGFCNDYGIEMMKGNED